MALRSLAENTESPYGIKLDSVKRTAHRRDPCPCETEFAVVDRRRRILGAFEQLIADVRGAGGCVLAEVKSADWPEAALAPLADGLMLKGQRGGRLRRRGQQLHSPAEMAPADAPAHLCPGRHDAACGRGMRSDRSCGRALDSQLLLMNEIRLPHALGALIGNLSGSETVAVGQAELGEYFRLLVRPGLGAARQFVADCDGLDYEALRRRVVDRVAWLEPAHALLPIGQDVAFAASWRKRFGSVGAVLRAIDLAVEGQPSIAQRCNSIAEGAPLARALGISLPIIQGPMTRVSDTPNSRWPWRKAARCRWWRSPS